jgi:hypothetical protein
MGLEQPALLCFHAARCLPDCCRPLFCNIMNESGASQTSTILDATVAGFWARRRGCPTSDVAATVLSPATCRLSSPITALGGPTARREACRPAGVPDDGAAECLKRPLAQLLDSVRCYGAVSQCPNVTVLRTRTYLPPFSDVAHPV